MGGREGVWGWGIRTGRGWSIFVGMNNYLGLIIITLACLDIVLGLIKFGVMICSKQLYANN